MPALSIVVPTYNRWSQLTLVLEALGRQTVPEADLEIVVVSDGSTDGTDDRLASGESPVPIKFVQQPNQGVAVARNNGVANASGELILFIDDDVVAEPECAAIHLRAHRDGPPKTVVIGPLLTPEASLLEPWVQWEQDMLYKQYDAMARGDWEPTARQFYTGNASLGREHFLASGGFDPSFRRGEDVELAYRLNDDGFRFSFSADARAFHHASRSYESWISNATSYGRNDAMLWRDKGQTWLMPTVRAEFDDRNPFTKIYTQIGLRAPAVTAVTGKTVEPLCRLASRAGVEVVAQKALSAVYNLAYYQGVVSELGSIDALMDIEPRAAQGSLHLDGPAR